MSLWSNTKQPNTDLQHKLDSAKTADDTKKVTIDNKSKNGQDSEQKKNRPPNTAPTTRSSLQAALICLFSKECAHLHNRDTYGHLIGSNGKLSIVFFFQSDQCNSLSEVLYHVTEEVCLLTFSSGLFILKVIKDARCHKEQLHIVCVKNNYRLYIYIYIYPSM